MRSPGGFLLLACIGALLLPGVNADPSATTPLVYVVVEDRFDEGCSTRVSGACIANVSGLEGGPGNATIDAHHELRYAGIATNASVLREATGERMPFPEESFGVDFGSFFIPHPIFILADQASHDTPWPDERYRLDATPEYLAVRYAGPSPWNPALTFEDQAFGVEYDPNSIGYGGARLPNAPGPWISDRDLNQLPDFCGAQSTFREAMGGEECEGRMTMVAMTAKDATPSITAGLHFHRTEVATDPSSLHQSRENDTEGGSSLPVVLRRTQPTALDIRTTRQTPSDPSARPPSPAGESLPLRDVPRPPVSPSPEGVSLASKAAPEAPPRSWFPVAALATGVMISLLAAILYSRFTTHHDLLASPVRQRLVELARAEPGIGLAAAATSLGLTINGARHHVRLLAKAGLLTVVSHSHRMLLFPPGARSMTLAPSTRIRQAMAQDEVVRVLVSSPEGLTRKELNTQLAQMPKRTRNHRLRRLLDMGVIEERLSEDGSVRMRVKAIHSLGMA